MEIQPDIELIYSFVFFPHILLMILGKYIDL